MVYCKLFHGRDTPEQAMDDRGFEGPTLGPSPYFHVTYGYDLKFEVNGKDERILIHEGLVEYEGKYYGDFTITSEPS